VLKTFVESIVFAITPIGTSSPVSPEKSPLSTGDGTRAPYDSGGSTKATTPSGDVKYPHAGDGTLLGLAETGAMFGLPLTSCGW